MADQMTGPTPRCQWCSAVLPAPDLATCPSCGATLTSATGTEDIKGVTTLDPEAILRARAEVSRPRSRLLSFITGEAPVEVGSETEQAAIAAPDDAVRLEMRRLELEAERADLEAETVAMKSEVVVEKGIDLGALATEAAAAEAASPSPAPATDAPPPTASATDAPPPPPAAPGS
jgi:hypothetical protein